MNIKYRGFEINQHMNILKKIKLKMHTTIY